MTENSRLEALAAEHAVVPRTQVLEGPVLQAAESNHPPYPESRGAWPVIPGYEILGELGRGGMGVVYLARQSSLKRLVALKMILVGADATMRVRFRTEAEAVARLRHANIVQIHEVGEQDGRPFICLEYVEGGSLQAAVASEAQPEREAARLVATLARAMHYTHQCGILHRDLKPNNILLTRDGMPKITDFGLAKLLDQGGGPTRAEALIGTPNYMPPEQAAGNVKKIGVPADVYSLGAILYELLTGRAPFRGTTLLNTLEQVRTQEPVAPRRVRGLIGRDLETICLKCLEKEPDNRYASAAALADDLERYLEGQSIRARPLALWQQLWRYGRRRPALIASAAAAAALLCLLVTSWAYYRAAGQLGRHDAQEKYKQFVERRNEALFYGLLSPDQGALFLGTEAAANLKSAASAATEALALAGVNVETDHALASSLPSDRKPEIDADCYALLLVLAAVKGRQPQTGRAEKQSNQEPLRILDRARGLGFETRAYHLRRALYLEQEGNLEAAATAREQSASLPIDSALDHFLLGEEQYRRGDWTEAKNSFNRALGLQPAHFWARFFLGVCHLNTGHWEAAKAGLGACLNQHPDFVWGYLFRSFANEKLRALAEAEADFQKALRLNPSEDARYVLFLTRGILHFNQNELELAAGDFRSAMDLRPTQYNAYLNLAQAYLAQRKFDEAADLLRQAMRLDPPVQVLVGYHVERGRNLLRDQKHAEAVASCAEALRLDPRQPKAYKVRAHALLGLARFQEAERAFDHYLENEGETLPDIFRGRGLARMKLGKYPDAAEDYTRALERDPEADLYQHRGWAHFFCEAWKLALRDFSKAVELDAEAGDAYTGRGLARVMLGNHREAIEDAADALRRKPSTPEMMHNLACIFAQAAVRMAADADVENRQSLAASYRDRALELIQKTLQMLPPEERAPFWRDKILPDPALAPLRGDERFPKLPW